MSAFAGVQLAFAAGCVVSRSPLVTVSKSEAVLPLGLASLAPERFADQPSLNFIGLTWSHETTDLVQDIARHFAEAERVLPKARFVIMASTPTEQVQFARAGVPNILANELIFVDERLFVPPPRGATRRHRFDAVYNARFRPLKRHDLASRVDNLLLVYGEPEHAEFARVKQLLPDAAFANHANGEYRYIDEKTLRELLGECGVGLCLSPVEGAMRASIEYRLCGLPVVSIKSAGGRDRYLLGPHVRVVDADPDAVASAVRDLNAIPFDPVAVREFAGSLIAFDRYNFLSTVNKLVEHVFGVHDSFTSFRPFARFPVYWRTPAEIFAPLDSRVA
jgi:glycosyltransferase involved in cell wall biosynthesis